MLRAEGKQADDFNDLMRLVASGDATAAQLLRDAGRDVGDILVYTISATNPQILVVGGSLSIAGDFFIAGVKESLFRHGAPALTEGLQIERSQHPLGFGTPGALGLSAEHVLSSGLLFDLLDVAGPAEE